MADNHFDLVIVWDNLGGAVRVNAGGKATVTDPATGALVTVVQDGQSVSTVTADENGRVSFVAQQGTVKLTAGGLSMFAVSAEQATAGAENAAAAQAAQVATEQARDDTLTGLAAKLDRTTADGIYGRRRKYDVRDYLGTDDIGAAINRAINAAAADAHGDGKPGQVILPPMNEALTTEIIPIDGVDVFGSGAGATVLRPQGIVCGVRLLRTDSTPLTGVTFAGFEIDGSEQTLNDGVYFAGAKGIFLQYVKRSSFVDLYIHDTAASGLGIDFLDDVVIDRVRGHGCGRLNDGSGPGGAGIGIGTGGWQVEAFKVSNFDVRDNGTYGIFVERQTTIRAYGASISNGYSSGNAKAGYCDAGMQDLTWSNCHSVGDQIGFLASGGTVGQGSPGRGDRLIGCTARSAVSHGFHWDGSGDTAGVCNAELHGFRAIDCGGDGGRFTAGSTLDVDGAKVIGGLFQGNGGAGIAFLSNGTRTWRDIVVASPTVKNNGVNTGATIRDGVHFGTSISKGRVSLIATNDSGVTTQQYGLSTAAGANLSSVRVESSNLEGNAVGAVNHLGTISNGSEFAGNGGYNPRGPIAVAPTASPFTYTNTGTSRGTLYVDAGTVSLITKSGVNLATQTGHSVELFPGESVTVTYSTAPNLKFDRK